jgi:hypothetical protein
MTTNLEEKKKKEMEEIKKKEMEEIKKREIEESLFTQFERVLRHENTENIKDNENTDIFSLFTNMFKNELS